MRSTSTEAPVRVNDLPGCRVDYSVVCSGTSASLKLQDSCGARTDTRHGADVSGVGSGLFARKGAKGQRRKTQLQISSTQRVSLTLLLGVAANHPHFHDLGARGCPCLQSVIAYQDHPGEVFPGAQKPPVVLFPPNATGLGGSWYGSSY